MIYPATRVLFVCHANVCRSPMAAATFEALAQDARLEVRAESAGVAALEGEDMDENARAALEEIGVYPAAHRARQVSRALVGEADLVLAMSPRQRDLLLENSEGPPPMIDTLPGYVGGARGGIADPHGRPMQSYRATCREILHHVGRLVDLVAASQRTGGSGGNGDARAGLTGPPDEGPDGWSHTAEHGYA